MRGDIVTSNNEKGITVKPPAKHCQDAWVYGNAQVYGNAWVSRDARILTGYITLPITNKE